MAGASFSTATADAVEAESLTGATEIAVDIRATVRLLWVNARGLDLAEATLELATCDPVKIAGRITQATPLLEELGVAIRTLDGSARYEG